MRKRLVCPALALRSKLKTRSTRSTANTQRFDDPESILRKARRSRRARKPSKNPVRLARSIGTPLIEGCPGVDPKDDDNSSDTEERFYRTRGYLPPRDAETAALIEAIIANPKMAKQSLRINPGHPQFERGLQDRNVSLSESRVADPVATYIKRIKLEESVRETDEEREYKKLWTLGEIKCKDGWNKALFQQTFMMSLLARYSLMNEARPESTGYLNFSVEEVWTCPPMPTRAYTNDGQFLTQPKPELAVYFRREAIISNRLWSIMPAATIRLACYENDTEGKRIFHFFTIEVKEAPDDRVGKHQSLNNASQALHNMFEFFKDAGPEHEERFFKEVRFFSVVASIKGLKIRIHRATRVRADKPDMSLIMPDRPDYPLRFEHKEFARVEEQDFDWDTASKTFERILVGYGVKKLGLLLSDAAKAIMEKLNKDPVGMRKREYPHFYRHGQTKVKLKSATAASNTPSVSNRSIDSLPDKILGWLQNVENGI